MEYIKKPFLENCGSCSYGLHDYLALKSMEYKNSVGNYGEKVDFSMQ